MGGVSKFERDRRKIWEAAMVLEQALKEQFALVTLLMRSAGLTQLKLSVRDMMENGPATFQTFQFADDGTVKVLVTINPIAPRRPEDGPNDRHLAGENPGVAIVDDAPPEPPARVLPEAGQHDAMAALMIHVQDEHAGELAIDWEANKLRQVQCAIAFEQASDGKLWLTVRTHLPEILVPLPDGNVAIVGPEPIAKPPEPRLIIE